MASYDWKVSALKAAKQLFLTVAAAVVAAGIAALTTPEFNAQLKALVEGVAGSIPVVGKVLVPALYSAVLGVVAAAAAAGLNWKKNHNL